MLYSTRITVALIAWLALAVVFMRAVPADSVAWWLLVAPPVLALLAIFAAAILTAVLAWAGWLARR